jgi:cytochrome b pre-mRNA-processing protein 3
MIFKFSTHNNDLYNTLLTLSRNIFFYKNLQLQDNFETRINLIFFHFSIMMIIFKKKGQKFDQKSYDSLFFNIENNLRELGFGDVAVNSKMKNLNKILYDILLKIENNGQNDKKFRINSKLVLKYFSELKEPKNDKFLKFETYLLNFYKFCFELPLKNMIEDVLKFKL